MPNAFVDYLNSMNNADANAKGALAESQVTSPFYEKILVERGIGNVLLDWVQESPRTIILTGHAGDGKTSLLAQVLKTLNCLPSGQKLQESDEVQSSQGQKLFYVKDMSELTKSRQVELLGKALDSPRRGVSAILVSNTGPLINTALKLMSNASADESDRLMMVLLDRMDNSTPEPVDIAGKACYIVNMARVDNVAIASKVLTKILQPKLWEDCIECRSNGVCPIKANRDVVWRNLSRVNHFSTAFYRYLYEHDKRLTVRQILAHLSYSIAGNLSCRDVPRLDSAPLYRYHFANLFFGYRGWGATPRARQIRAISELQALGIDTISLRSDYRLFVQHDYSVFDEETANILRESYQLLEHLSKPDQRSQSLLGHRRSVRRFYLLFSNLTDSERDALLGEIYSPIYPVYLKARDNPIDPVENKYLKTMVFNALYAIYVGTPPTTPDDIPLTIRRNRHTTQYVQLLQGQVPAQDLSIKQVKGKNSIDPEATFYELRLHIRNVEDTVLLTYPLLDYFWRIANGAVDTALSPSLSHGIDRLKARLLQEYSQTPNDGQKDMQLLLQTNQGVKRVYCYFVDNNLHVGEV